MYPHDDERCRQDSVDAAGFRDACRALAWLAEAAGLPDTGWTAGEIADALAPRLAASEPAPSDVPQHSHGPSQPVGWDEDCAVCNPLDEDAPTIEDVLAEHLWHHTRETHCACGFRTPLAQLAIAGYLAHVAAEIREAGAR